MPEGPGPQKVLHSLGAVVPKTQLSQGAFSAQHLRLSSH